MSFWRVVASGALATTLIGVCAAPQIVQVNQGFAAEGQESASFADGSSVTAILEGTCEKQEVIYASMTAAGAVKNLYAVNELFSDVPVMVRDFGTYTQTVNLTDDAALATEADSVVCVVEDESFVYQGNLASTDLPWIVSISYELDGASISAGDLAGASGDLKLSIETRQNTAVDPLYFDNYMLQITCTLPMDNAIRVETEDGPIALSGSDTTVAFTALPGKSGTYTLSAQVEDFEMDGIQIAGIPFSMAIEMPDTDSLVSQFDELISGADKLNAGAASLKDGANALAQGTNKLDSGVDALQGGTEELSAGMSAYLAGVAQVNAGLAQAAAGSQVFADKLAELKTTSDQIAQSLGTTKSDLEALALDIQNSPTMSTAEKDAILAKLGAMPQSFEMLKQYVDGVGSLSDGYEELNSSIAQLAVGLDRLAEQNDQLFTGAGKLGAGVDQLAGSTGGLSSGSNQLAEGAAALADGTNQLTTESQTIPDRIREEIDSMMASYNRDDFTPKSFTDARNTNVNLVQFVMTTEGITVPDEPIEESEPEDESFLSRFFALFS